MEKKISRYLVLGIICNGLNRLSGVVVGTHGLQLKDLCSISLSIRIKDFSLAPSRKRIVQRKICKAFKKISLFLCRRQVVEPNSLTGHSGPVMTKDW